MYATNVSLLNMATSNNLGTGRLPVRQRDAAHQPWRCPGLMIMHKSDTSRDGSDLRDCPARLPCGTKNGLAMRLATNRERFSLMASTTVTGHSGVGGDISDRRTYRAARQR